MKVELLKILHKQIETAGIPIEGVSGDGSINFLPEATTEQREQAAVIVATFDEEREQADIDNIEMIQRDKKSKAKNWVKENLNLTAYFFLEADEMKTVFDGMNTPEKDELLLSLCILIAPLARELGLINGE